MINRLPRHTADFETMLKNLAVKPHKYPDLAKRLGVSTSTIYRWKKDGAPRVTLLALWWISNEGLSTWDAEAFNQVNEAKAWTAALEAENQTLRTINRKLGQLGEFGSANDPTAHAPALSARPLPPCLERGKLPRTIDDRERIAKQDDSTAAVLQLRPTSQPDSQPGPCHSIDHGRDSQQSEENGSPKPKRKPLRRAD